MSDHRLRGPKSSKDFENSLVFWKEYGEMAKAELEALRSENGKFKSILIKTLAAMIIAFEKECGCESGGGPGDIEPGFICGYHELITEIEQALQSTPDPEEKE